MQSESIVAQWPFSSLSYRWDADIRIPRPPAVEVAETETKPVVLIAESDRRHEFGAAIARPGRTLTYIYHLTNNLERPIKLGVENHRPCCGDVKLSKAALAPGESAEVEVKLSVSGKFGEVVHETGLHAEPTVGDEIILRTTAQALPAVRVEELPTTAVSLLVGGPSREIYLDLIATGTADDPPLALDRLEVLSSKTQVRWQGPSEHVYADDGLVVVRRRVMVVEGTEGEPGPHTATVFLRDGKTTVFEHAISWETIPPLTVAPRALVMKRGDNRHQLVILAQDGKEFRLLQAGCDRDTITPKIQSEKPGTTQVVTVRIAENTAKGSGTLTLTTNHPTQSTVKVPLIVLD